MNHQSSLSAVKTKFVTAEDINQLRQCFYAMEEIAQKSIQAKNRTIGELQDEIADLKGAINQRSAHINSMVGDINAAKTRLKAGGPGGVGAASAGSGSDDLLDLIDAQQQASADELRRRGDALRDVEARMAAVDGERRDMKNQLDYYKRKEDDLRRVIAPDGTIPGSTARGGGGGADDRDVVAMLEDRLAADDRATRDRENQLAANQAKVADLHQKLDERDRQVQKLQAERADAVDRLRAAKEAVLGSQVGSKFRFVNPQATGARGTGAGGGGAFGDDINAAIDARDREILEELNARDDELGEMRGRLRQLEDTMSGKVNDVEKLKSDLAAAEQERDAKIQEIQDLNGHARTQANVIRRKIEELEDRDAQIADNKTRLKAAEKDLDDRIDHIESIEDELRVRDEQIGGLQRKLQRAQEDIGSKLVVLSLLLEKLTAAKEDFEARDEEIDELSAKLNKVEEERRGMEDTLNRYKADEINIMHDHTNHLGGAGGGGYRDEAGNYHAGRAPRRDQGEEELDRLFQNARATLGVLGEKANFSFAALKTKDDLDSLYNEQLTVTGAEMILRDRKINLLVEKVEIAERYLNELLKILGQKGLMKYGSARGSTRGPGGAATAGASSASLGGGFGGGGGGPSGIPDLSVGHGGGGGGGFH